MYRVKQLTTTPYNPCGNSTCEMFNCMLHDLLKTLDKEQKAKWPLHLPSLVFAYNAMPHSVTGYQPYKLMFGCKDPTVCHAWFGLAKYNDQYSQSESAWVNKQHEVILAVNRWALKNIKQTANKIVLHAGGSPLDIPKDNLVIFWNDKTNIYGIEGIVEILTLILFCHISVSKELFIIFIT